MIIISVYRLFCIAVLFICVVWFDKGREDFNREEVYIFVFLFHFSYLMFFSSNFPIFRGELEFG